MMRRALSTMSVVNAGLVANGDQPGWAESRFIDVPMEKVHEQFLDMIGAQVEGNGKFNGQKLRVRFAGEEVVGVGEGEVAGEVAGEGGGEGKGGGGETKKDDGRAC